MTSLVVSAGGWGALKRSPPPPPYEAQCAIYDVVEEIIKPLTRHLYRQHLLVIRSQYSTK